LVAALAVMPAAAQAVPHFYSNKVILPEEEVGAHKGKDIIAWGTLVLITKTLSVMTCQNAFGGEANNPVGGGAGEGRVFSYAVWNCTNELCEVTFKSKQEIVPEGLDKFGFWETHLVEPVAGKIRLKTGNTTEGSPTQIKFLIACPPAGLGEIKTKSKGELTPLIENGTSIGAAPSKVNFDAESGELEIANVKEGKVTEKLKTMGYEGSELIQSKNP
jgi:hypothetical protein